MDGKNHEFGRVARGFVMAGGVGIETRGGRFVHLGGRFRNRRGRAALPASCLMSLF